MNTLILVVKGLAALVGLLAFLSWAWPEKFGLAKQPTKFLATWSRNQVPWLKYAIVVVFMIAASSVLAVFQVAALWLGALTVWWVWMLYSEKKPGEKETRDGAGINGDPNAYNIAARCLFNVLFLDDHPKFEPDDAILRGRLLESAVTPFVDVGIWSDELCSALAHHIRALAIADSESERPSPVYRVQEKHVNTAKRAALRLYGIACREGDPATCKASFKTEV